MQLQYEIGAEYGCRRVVATPLFKRVADLASRAIAHNDDDGRADAIMNQHCFVWSCPCVHPHCPLELYMLDEGREHLTNDLWGLSDEATPELSKDICTAAIIGRRTRADIACHARD